MLECKARALAFAARVYADIRIGILKANDSQEQQLQLSGHHL